MKPKAKRFDKANRCTKVDIWRCFRGRRGFRTINVVEAHAIIGTNAPRNMLQRGYVELDTGTREDTYTLTKAGRVWLTNGIRNHLVRHIEDYDKVSALPYEVKLELAPRLEQYRKQLLLPI